MSECSSDTSSTVEEVTADPLKFVTQEAGFLPTMGVHRDGTRLVVSPSRSRWVFAIGAWTISVILLLIDVPFFPFLWVLTPPLIIGSIVGVFAMPAIIRAFGRQAEMVVDPASRSVTVTRGRSRKEIPFDRMVGYQLLPRSGRRQAGQLNLVFRDEEGKVDRTCLMSHAVHYYLVRAARKLAAHSCWPVFDHTGQALDPSS